MKKRRVRSAHQPVVVSKGTEANKRGPSRCNDQRIARAGSWLVVSALVAASFAVDPAADAAFDAPKWLLVNLSAIVATALLIWRAAFGDAVSPPWSVAQRLSLAGVIGAIILATASAITSAHGALAIRALLGGLATATLLLVGASPMVERDRRGLLVKAAVAVSGATLALSLAQYAGLQLPIAVERVGGRYPTGALLGNEGYVALLAALTAAVCVASLLSLPVHRLRTAGLVALIILSLLVIGLNRQLTSGIALLLAVAVVVALRFGRRWLAGLIVAALVGGSITAMVPLLRQVTWAAVPGADISTYQVLTTFRLGGWVAAEEMVRDAPLLGRGPGSFGAESTTRRLDAELRYGTRFLQPTGATFVRAHQDWLQLAAECGVPAALLALAAYLTVLAGLYHAYAKRGSAEALVLVAVLITAGVSSLTWFPMQIPVTAAIVLLAAGRAWQLCSVSGGTG